LARIFRNNDGYLESQEYEEHGEIPFGHGHLWKPDAQVGENERKKFVRQLQIRCSIRLSYGRYG
jgi:hypothetical protein